MPIIRVSFESRRYRRSHRINFHTRPHDDDPRGTIRLLSRRNDRWYELQPEENTDTVGSDGRRSRFDVAVAVLSVFFTIVC